MYFGSVRAFRDRVFPQAVPPLSVLPERVWMCLGVVDLDVLSDSDFDVIWPGALEWDKQLVRH